MTRGLACGRDGPSGPARPGAQWLAVQAAERGYLLPLCEAGEIFPWAGVQRVPHTRPWFLGLANLRGRLAGVVDLARFLGHGGPRDEAALAVGRLLLLDAAPQMHAAVLLDRLLGLRSARDFAQVEPAAEAAPDFLGRVHIDGAGRRWQQLGLLQLARAPDFLDIRA